MVCGYEGWAKIPDPRLVWPLIDDIPETNIIPLGPENRWLLGSDDSFPFGAIW